MPFGAAAVGAAAGSARTHTHRIRHWLMLPLLGDMHWYWIWNLSQWVSPSSVMTALFVIGALTVLGWMLRNRFLVGVFNHLLTAVGWKVRLTLTQPIASELAGLQWRDLVENKGVKAFIATTDCFFQALQDQKLPLDVSGFFKHTASNIVDTITIKYHHGTFEFSGVYAIKHTKGNKAAFVASFVQKSISLQDLSNEPWYKRAWSYIVGEPDFVDESHYKRLANSPKFLGFVKYNLLKGIQMHCQTLTNIDIQLSIAPPPSDDRE